MNYQHTQRGGLFWVLIAATFLPLLPLLWIERIDPNSRAVVLFSSLFSGGLVACVSFCFRELTISDQEDVLRVAFGPIPLFRKQVPFAEIVAAEPGRTSLLDGWGIHCNWRGTWTWNLWGFDCVRLTLRNGRRLNLGTDDPQGLATFLATRIAGPTAER